MLIYIWDVQVDFSNFSDLPLIASYPVVFRQIEIIQDNTFICVIALEQHYESNEDVLYNEDVQGFIAGRINLMTNLNLMTNIDDDS